MLHTFSLPTGHSKTVRIGGWKRQMNDPRDEPFKIKLHRAMLGAAPSKCDNRAICSPVEDQGELGSCTANAFAALIEANEIRGGAAVELHTVAIPTINVSTPVIGPDGSIIFQTTVQTVAQPPKPAPSKRLVDVSRLLHYYATRKLMGTVKEDSGATIRDTIKAGAKYGVADEKLWPYQVTKFADDPPPAVWTEALKHKVISYHAIADGDIESMKATLLTGLLIEFGFVVYSYMTTDAMAAKGILPRPGPTEQAQGGHAVVLVGYDDTMPMPDGSRGAFLVRNSWGPKWGLGGYFWMGYSYVGDPTLASDFWVVQSASL